VVPAELLYEGGCEGGVRFQLGELVGVLEEGYYALLAAVVS